MISQNKLKQYHRDINTLAAVVHKISEKYEFDANAIIYCFAKDQISSANFTLSRFSTKTKFVNEFCQKRFNIKIASGTLIKLWEALNSTYNILLNYPCYPVETNPKFYDEQTLAFISKKSIRSIIKNKLIKEPFTSFGRLFQYLNWNMCINKISQHVRFFSISNNDIDITVMVINSELYDKNDQILYMLCVKNDLKTLKAQKWQFVQLLTEKQIRQFTQSDKMKLIISGFIRSILGSLCYVRGSVSSVTLLINRYLFVDLPAGVRHSEHQFEHVRDNKLPTKQQILRNNIKKTRYQQMKHQQTRPDKDKQQVILQVAINLFHNKINVALRSNDWRNNLIAIVSKLKGRKYSVDQILPVQINNNWIVVVYRNGLPMGTLIDKYDIINKAILCDPTFDERKLDFFVNNITKIEIAENCSSICNGENNVNHNKNNINGKYIYIVTADEPVVNPISTLACINEGYVMTEMTDLDMDIKQQDYLTLSPHDIYYTQDSISNRWGSYTSHSNITIMDTLNALRNGEINIYNIQAICIIEHDHRYYSLNNRRLWVFKQFGQNILCEIYRGSLPNDKDYCAKSIAIRDDTIY